MTKTIKLVPLERQKEDKELMRWLYYKGVQPWEMSNLRVGSVDECEKTIHVHPNTIGWSYNFSTKEQCEEKREREEWISFEGAPFERRLCLGAIYSKFVFTKSFPSSLSDDLCCYSVEEIENLLEVDYEAELEKKLLTKLNEFDRIKVSKTNIKSWKEEAGEKERVT